MTNAREIARLEKQRKLAAILREKADAEENDPEENEKDEVEVSPDTTLLHKLKAEEAKVAECMVGSLVPASSRLHSLQAQSLMPLHRAGYATCRPIT